MGQLALPLLQRQLASDGVAFAAGPFNFRVRSRLPGVARALQLLYENHPLLGGEEFCDCTLELNAPSPWRRWLRPQVQARFQGRQLFEPLPQDQAYALLEWTMNWWISNHAHQYLLLHAAVVARDGGRALILPAPPGSGKSTLCAALIQRGWRLMSDEMAMVSMQTGLLHGMARPVSLKNQSLQVIRGFEPAVVLGAAAHDTAKGTVAHLKPSRGHALQAAQPARAAWVVFPRYVAGAPASLKPRREADAMMELGRNAFNYPLLGLDGFNVLAAIVSTCRCFDFSYGQLDEAIAVFDRLASSAA